MNKRKNLCNLLIWIITIALVVPNMITNRLFFRDMLWTELAYIVSAMLFFLIPNQSFKLPCSIIRLTGFIRYVIYPVSVYAEEASGLYFSEEVGQLMILEILIVHFTIMAYYCGSVYRKTRKQIDQRMQQDTEIIPMQLGITALIITCIGIVIILRNPTVIMNFFAFNFSDKITTGLSGGSSIVLQITFLFAFIYLLTLIRKIAWMPEKIKLFISFILTALYANGRGITTENVSRWTIIVSMIVGIVFILSLYPERTKMIVAVSILFISGALIFSTLLKQEMWGTVSKGIGNVVQAKSLNGYFSGSLNLEKGIDMLQTTDINRVETFISDLFANFPFLNHFVDVSKTTTTYFNYSFYGSSIARDQICPMIIQLKEYFGLIGYVVYGIIVFLACHIYTLSKRVHNLIEKNILVILAFYFSLVFCLNWSILFEVLWIQILPLILVNYFTIRVNLRKGID